jgi:hypothetical protein
MYVCIHAQVHDPRADGEHVPDRVARRSSRSRRPLESGDRETPNLCGEAKGVEFTLETRQMEQVRVMPHRLHMRRACGLGSNSSVLRSRLRSRRLSKGGCAAASTRLSAGGEHASTESMPLCDILRARRRTGGCSVFTKKKSAPIFNHTSTRGVPSPGACAEKMDGNVLMEKVLAVENRPVLLAGIALGGIAAAIFMKRLGPMRVLGIARCARHRQLWFLGLHVVRGWRGGAEPAGAAQRILMRQAHARRSTAPPLARQTRAGRPHPLHGSHNKGTARVCRILAMFFASCGVYVCVCVVCCVCRWQGRGRARGAEHDEQRIRGLCRLRKRARRR